MAKISQNASRACKMEWLLVRQMTKFYLTNKELIQNIMTKDSRNNRTCCLVKDKKIKSKKDKFCTQQMGKH